MHLQFNDAQGEDGTRRYVALVATTGFSLIFYSKPMRAKVDIVLEHSRTVTTSTTYFKTLFVCVIPFEAFHARTLPPRPPELALILIKDEDEVLMLMQ